MLPGIGSQQKHQLRARKGKATGKEEHIEMATCTERGASNDGKPDIRWGGDKDTKSQTLPGVGRKLSQCQAKHQVKLAARSQSERKYSTTTNASRKTSSKLYSSSTGQKKGRGIFTLLGARKRGKRIKQDYRLSELTSEIEEQVIYKDIPYNFSEDYMHSLVGTSWRELIICCFAAVILLVFAFAVLFYLATPASNRTSERDWWDSYNLALQTWCTIGYGVLAPANDAQEAVSLFCTFSAFCFTALITGITFIKFSLPYASIQWSNAACIHNYRYNDSHKRVLVMRCATMSESEVLVDCQFSAFILAPRVTEEGESFVSSQDLKLRNPDPILIGPAFTIIHDIEPHGHLWDFCCSKKDAIEDFIVVVRLIGYSMNFQSTVASTKFYHVNDLKKGHRFENAIRLHEQDTNTLIVDLESLHLVNPIVSELDLAQEYHHGGVNHLLDYSLTGLPNFSQPKEEGIAGKLEQSGVAHVQTAVNNTAEDIKSGLRRASTATMMRDRLHRQSRFRRHKFQQTRYEQRCCSRMWHCICFMCTFQEANAKPTNRLKYIVKGRPTCFSCQPRRWYISLTQGRWFSMIFFLMIMYMGSIFLFAFLMFADKDSLLQEPINEDRPFLSYIWWSHHTLSTVGYGTLTPGNSYGEFLVTFEGIAGLILLSTLSGITWAKFSGISARVLWSRNAVVAQLDKSPHFMIRVASLWKGHLMLTAKMRMSAIVRPRDADETLAAIQVPIKLIRNNNPLIALTATFMHKIDINSPILGLLPRSFREEHGMLLPGNKEPPEILRVICLLETFDGLFQTEVVSHRFYTTMQKEKKDAAKKSQRHKNNNSNNNNNNRHASESEMDFAGNEIDDDDDDGDVAGPSNRILIGHRFDDVIAQQEDTNKVIIDYSKFHDTSVDRKCRLVKYLEQEQRGYDVSAYHLGVDGGYVPRKQLGIDDNESSAQPDITDVEVVRQSRSDIDGNTAVPEKKQEGGGYRVPLRIDEESGQIDGSNELNKEGK